MLLPRLCKNVLNGPLLLCVQMRLYLNEAVGRQWKSHIFTLYVCTVHTVSYLTQPKTTNDYGETGDDVFR